MKDPSVTVPLAFTGALCIRGPGGSIDHEKMSWFLRCWLHAEWKQDPSAALLVMNWSESDIKIAEIEGYVARRDGQLVLTGPNRDPQWLAWPSRAMHTYAIEAVGQGMVKVGRSRDIKRRQASLQRGLPYRLKLIATLDRDFEAEMHRQLDLVSARVHGEWFRCDQITRDLLWAFMDMEPS